MTRTSRLLARYTVVVALVLVAFCLVCAILVQGWRLWLLLFAASLLALLVRGLAAKLQEWTGLGPRLSLWVTLISGITLAVGASFLLAPGVAAQSREFADLVPKALQRVRQWVERVPGGPTLRDSLSQGGLAGELRSAGKLVRESVSGVIGLVVVVVTGIYLAVQPEPYVDGAVRLIPRQHRPKARALLHELGRSLKLFLAGRLASMVFVAPLTGIVLWILGVPVPGMLALLAGLFTFVPYAGPVAAAVPILLVSATGGASTLVWVGLLYIGIQAVEGFVITPLVQQKAVHMPPVVTIAAEVLAGSVFGPLGVVVSVPLAVVASVSIRSLYVQGVLEKDVDPDQSSSDAEACEITHSD